MKIGIIRENKVPIDKRAPFSPEQCKQIKQIFPNIEIVVQPSEVRCFQNTEYASAGIPVQEDISDCDILFGVKEVPVEALIPNKTYFFFSHTIKKQAHNRKLLQAMLEKNIRMVDYETLTDQKGIRVVAFGRYAGLVGAYNGIIAYGRRSKSFEIKPAHQCFDLQEMFGQLSTVKLPAIKIAITGNGRVANGAMEVLDFMKIRKVSPQEYIEQTFQEAVYTVLDSQNYHASKNGEAFDTPTFFKYPEKFVGTFSRYYPHTDMLIAAAFWDPQAPVLFTPAETRRKDFRIKVIADITCDINGSIPTTQRASTIAEPLYDYNPQTENIEMPLSNPQNITVMAIDNLPCEVPRDSSESFGKDLISKVLPHLFGNDSEEVISRATICLAGELTEKYLYLEDYVKQMA